MMDRNREARRAAAMAANGLQRRRHRTSSNPGTLRDSPEEEGSMELQEVARFRDRTVRKERDRDRERGREKERERLNRSKRRRNDKYIHGGNSVREDGGVGIDDSSEESVNDDEEDDDDGPVGFVPQSNPVSVSTSTSPVTDSSPLTSQRRSYPPPSKVYRVTPSWKAPDEMIGVSVPRKARSASTKRSHECWTSNGVAGESSSSPAAGTTTTPARPMSPSSSNVSLKKKIKHNGGIKHRPPKPLMSKSSQDEIEIEVAEVLYGLMRQTQPTSKVEPNKLDSRSSEDSKSGVLSHGLPNQNYRSSTPLTVVAPKRKRPRLYPDENPRNNHVSTKPEIEQPQKMESQSPIPEKIEGSIPENVGPISEPTPVVNNGVALEKMVEEINGGRNNKMAVRSTTKVEEVSSSSPKLEFCQNHDHLEKTNSTHVEKENRRGDKFEIDLMAPASPEKEEEMGEYTGKREDEKSMVMDRETETKSKQNEVKDHKSINGSVPEFNVAGDDSKVACGPDFSTKPVSLSFPPSQHQHHQQQHQQQSIVSNPNGKDREKEKESSFGLQLDLEKGGLSNTDSKVNFQQHKLQQPNSHLDNKIGFQSNSMALPMSVPAGWHGGLPVPPMGYMGPLQGVVSMDGTTMASPPIQPPPPPPFIFSPPKPKRCATHCYIARSISGHQQMMKMTPYWPPPSYNLNMVPSADLHNGRGGSTQESRGQPYAFFPPPALNTKDNASQAAAPALDSAQKKQFLLPPGLPPGAAGNMMQMQHAPPALFFPMGQQQAAASVRPGSGKNPSMPTGVSSTSTFTSSPMAATMSNASPAGPAMSFSYPNINGNEAQFMAILGNGPYPFIPGHVGATPPYRGSHPQAMPFFNGSFYSSQMLHPSQLQPPPQSGGQNHLNASMSTTGSSSSHKHLQTQQSRVQGSGANVVNPNQNQNSSLQNFQATKCRETGGSEDSPSTADSRNRPSMSAYGQNFVMPFNSPNFAMMPSPLGSGGVPNGIHGDKKQSQQAALSSPFAMSFTNINGATTPGLDMSSMVHNHAYLQSLPEAAKQNYQMMAAAQAAQQGKTKYHVSEDGKKGVGTSTDPSNLDEERRAMAAKVSAASSGQSIAFSRELAENTVVDSSARSLNLGPGSGSTRPARSSGPHTVNNSPNSQQQSQMLFPKQQHQYTPPNSANARSKTPSTSSGNVYPDHLNSSTIMAAKFPSNLSAFPSIVQTSVGPTQSQWKNSVRPNTSQSPSPSNTTTSNMKNLPQQQGRSQGQSHTQISFGPSATNSKQSAGSPGQQTQNSSQAPSSPMLVGSPSTSSISKSAGGSPRTNASNKSVGQGPSLSSQQGKNSTSQPTSAQKPSILGSSPQIMSTTGPTGKTQLQQPPQQPQLSKQSIQQAQLYFSNYMQANPSAAMAGTGYYLQRQNRPDAQQLQQQQQQLQSLQHQQLQHSIQQQQIQGLQQGSKSQGSKSQGSIPPTSSSGMFNVSQFASPGGPNQLMPASFPYVHAVSTPVPVKPTEQKQPAGE